MNYERIREARFLARPNRFLATVELNGREEVCHVKNTGRCRELLIPGARIWIQEAANPLRKTKYDLISVEKGAEIVNIDSQIPNRVVEEWLFKKELFKDLSYLKAEKKYGDSRFDFYLEAGEEKIFMEVKGVTLEEEGIARFPDAPTERGIKHLQELVKCRMEGYQAYLIFVIQMKGVQAMEPNDRTHQAFGEALREAKKAGVQILAYDSFVTPDSIVLDKQIPVFLTRRSEIC